MKNPAASCRESNQNLPSLDGGGPGGGGKQPVTPPPYPSPVKGEGIKRGRRGDLTIVISAGHPLKMLQGRQRLHQASAFWACQWGSSGTSLMPRFGLQE